MVANAAAAQIKRMSSSIPRVMWWWSNYWPMAWMFFGPVMMIIFAIICMTMMFFMMRGGMMHRSRGGRAIDILKERYARSEINQAEYEERRRLLEA